MRTINILLLALSFVGLCFCYNISFIKQKTYFWLPYYYTPKQKNFDFNDYVKVFAYSGDRASIEYKMYYPNVTDKCKYPGRKITFDLDIRVWLKNGSFKYYYIKKVCVNSSEHSTDVYCTKDNCYIVETCFYNGYKDLCKQGDEDDIFVVYNKSINIWRIDKYGNLSLIYNTTGFKSAGDGIDLECNNLNICWDKIAPNNGVGYYIFNFNNFDNGKVIIDNISFDNKVDSIFFVDNNHYVYHSKDKIYDQNNNVLYTTKNKIKSCVIYSKTKIYCLLQNKSGGFINTDLVYFDLKNKRSKLLKSFPKFGLFEKIVAKGYDKSKNTIFFVCQAPGLDTIDYYLVMYNIKNGKFSYTKINSIKTGFWEFYGKIKKYRFKNGSLVWFGFPDKQQKNISLKYVKIPLNDPYKIEVIDNFNKTVRDSLLDMFSYTIEFKSILQNKIPIVVYLNDKKIKTQNVSNGEVIEFLKKFNKPQNITVKVCYKANCTEFKYQIIQPKINKTQNKTVVKLPIKNNETTKKLVHKKQQTKNNNLFIYLIAIIIIALIILFAYIKKKNEQLKSDMM